MILRKWWAVAACVVALSGSAHAQAEGNGQEGNGQEQNAQPKKAEPETPQANVSSPAVEAQRPNESTAEAKVYEPNCREPKSQPEADLCVQRRVADTAEEALHWTRIQTWGALVGLGLVLATLGVTAWTGKAAMIAAQAAVDAVGTERAWMTSTGLNCGTAQDAVVDGVLVPLAEVFSLQWINTGRSPALRGVFSRRHMIVDINDNVSAFDDVDGDEMAGQPHSFALGAGQIVGSMPFAIYGQELQDLISSRTKILIHARAEYETSYSKVRYFTDITADIKFNGIATAPGGVSQYRFTLEPRPGANGIGVVA